MSTNVDALKNALSSIERETKYKRGFYHLATSDGAVIHKDMKKTSSEVLKRQYLDKGYTLLDDNGNRTATKGGSK